MSVPGLAEALASIPGLRGQRKFDRRQVALGVVAGAAGMAAALGSVVAPAGRAADWLRAGVLAVTVASLAWLWWVWLAWMRSGLDAVAEFAGLPGGYLKPGDRRARYDVFRRELAGRYGSEAAARSGLEGRFLFRRVGVLQTLFVFAVANAYANVHQSTPGYIVIVIVLVPALIGSEKYARSLKAASRREGQNFVRARDEALGPVGRAALAVPSRAADYVTWCEQHGLTPYPYGRPDWTDRRH